MCWDANLRRSEGWDVAAFKGTKWQRISEAARRTYLINSYRVLLTRARQGMVIFVPRGNVADATRHPSLYDGTYKFLIAAGIRELVCAAAGEDADKRARRSEV